MRTEIIVLSVCNCVWQAVSSGRRERGGARKILYEMPSSIHAQLWALVWHLYVKLKSKLRQVALLLRTGQLFSLSLGSMPANDSELTERINLRRPGIEAGLQSEPHLSHRIASPERFSPWTSNIRADTWCLNHSRCHQSSVSVSCHSLIAGVAAQHRLFSCHFNENVFLHCSWLNQLLLMKYCLSQKHISRCRIGASANTWLRHSEYVLFLKGYISQIYVGWRNKCDEEMSGFNCGYKSVLMGLVMKLEELDHADLYFRSFVGYKEWKLKLKQTKPDETEITPRRI